VAARGEGCEEGEEADGGGEEADGGTVVADFPLLSID